MLGGYRQKRAPIAQLDRASVYGTEGYPFESDWVYSLRPLIFRRLSVSFLRTPPQFFVLKF